jgi:hypothetical protein
MGQLMRAVAFLCALLAAPTVLACDGKRAVADTLRTYDPLVLSQAQRRQVEHMTGLALGGLEAQHQRGRCGAHASVIAELSTDLESVLSEAQRAAMGKAAAERQAALRKSVDELKAITTQLRGWLGPAAGKPRPSPQALSERMDALLERARRQLRSLEDEQRLRGDLAKAQVAATRAVSWPDPSEGLRTRYAREASRLKRALRDAARADDQSVLRAHLAKAVALVKRLHRHRSYDVRRIGDALWGEARQLALLAGAMALTLDRLDAERARLVARDPRGLELELDADLVSGRDREGSALLHSAYRGARLLVLFEDGSVGTPVVAVYVDRR